MKKRLIAIVGGVTAVLVVGGLLVGLSPLGRSGNAAAETQPDNSAPAEGSKKQVPVVLTPARSLVFEQRVVVSGSVSAERYAMVSARIPGTLDAIFVDEGDRVEAGKSRLFQTDSLKLTKALAIAKQNLSVAEFAVKEKQALLEKDLVGREQVGNDVKRYRELAGRNAIAAQVLEQQEARYKQCDADVKHTETLIALAKAQLEQARLTLLIAEKDLGDSLVLAPISGRVSQRLREPGEMAAAGTPVLRIEDTSVLEISVFLPEEFYARVKTEQTQMRVRVGNTDLGKRPVSYKSPTVHPKMRTFEVKGLVKSPGEGIVPGCLAEVTIVTDSRPGVGVPAGALQTRGDSTVLFVVDDGKARMIPVQVGRQMEGWREILDGVSAGAAIVSMGQTLVEDGTPVSIVKEDVQ